MGYADIPLGLSLLFIVGGLAALTWSSDVFVNGAAALAKMLGISPFIIGMVIIGFGTSAPELCVSAMSGLTGHANLSLGNAYGSCIFNIAIILGIAALILPLRTKPSVTFFAGPLLAAITGYSAWILRDNVCTRGEALSLLVIFLLVMPAYCWFDQKAKNAADGPVKAKPKREELLSREVDSPLAAEEANEKTFGVLAPVGKIVVGLAVLVASSHFLVWGAVDFAKFVGVSDLVIGLTIVAAGTSLPELACAVSSAWRGEHEFVLGNIIGSNIFNTLGVVGVAVALSPLETGLDGSPAFSPFILTRDLPVMALMSLSISLFGINWTHPKRDGVIGRLEAVLWILSFIGYTVLMFIQESRVT